MSANFLREWRQHKQITLEQLAASVGATRSQMSRLETGNRRLTLDWMKRIAKVYGIPPQSLLQSPEPTGYPKNPKEVPPGAVSLVEMAGITSENLRVMQIRGDGMAPSLMPGDHVIIDESDRALAAGVYLVDFGNGAEIKRVAPTAKAVRLSTDNPAYAPFDADPRKLRVISRVVSRILRL